MVQVYCDEGVSRGPTVVAAYLIHHGWTLRTALAHLVSLRPEVGLTRTLCEVC
jgi:protein-tyrosine phosphatase